MESKNQKIVLHNYMLVAVGDVDTNENGVRTAVLMFKQTWTSPASSLFTKIFKIKVSEDNFNIDVARDMLHDGVNDNDIIYPGYISNGQLTLLVKLEPASIDLNDYETLICENLVK